MVSYSSYGGRALGIAAGIMMLVLLAGGAGAVGDIWAWGSNNMGQLGDGTTINRNNPVSVGLAGVNAIDGGYLNTFALNGYIASIGPVHNLNTSEDFFTIQAAIDNASPGDEIHVNSGTYYENVNVNKQLTLRGVDTGGGKPVVDAGGSGSAITLYTDGIALEGFTATGAGSFGAGILVYSNNNTLSGNNANLNNYSGIYLDSSSNNTLSGNNANSNSQFGIYLNPSSKSNNLTGNKANSNDVGILLINNDNNNLTSNDASNNRHGFDLDNSTNNNLTGNSASNNNNGIYLWSSSNNTIFGNFFNNTNNFYFGDSASYKNYWNTTKAPGRNIIGGPSLGGNFWANPGGTGFSQTCADADRDGICDSPYVLDSNNTDYLPLAAPATSESYVVYIPWTATTQGWTTPYVIANKGNSSANVNISYYNQADGSYIGNYSLNILPGASKFVFREWTTSSTDGSAVIFSNQPVSVIVDQFNNAQNKFGAYTPAG